MLDTRQLQDEQRAEPPSGYVWIESPSLTPTNGVRGGRFQVSSFRRFQEGAVSDNDSDNDCDSDEQRFWLEASTFSKCRGRSLRITGSQSAGWKPVPKHNLYSLLIAQCGTGFQPAVRSMTIIRRQMLSHFPTALKVLAFSQNTNQRNQPL